MRIQIPMQIRATTAGHSATLGVICMLLMLASVGHAAAASISLAWDPVVSVPVTGYKVHYGSSVGNYPSVVDVGNATTTTINNLVSGAPYHFVVTAYNAAGAQSGNSNDVGPPDIAVYRKVSPTTGAPVYSYFLDYNYDHTWDVKIPFGMAGDVPLAGDVNGDGFSDLVLYRNGTWFADFNKNGTVDQQYVFGGVPGDIPLLCDFNGDGTDDLVIFRNGAWYISTTRATSVSLTYYFGAAGDIPVCGEINGDGTVGLAVYRNGIWYIDGNHNGVIDAVVAFGGVAGDVPVLVDWYGNGKSGIGILRNGVWYISTKRDGIADVIFSYGATGDMPLVGIFH